MSGGGGGGGGIDLGPLGKLNLSDTNSMVGAFTSPEAWMISQGWFGSGLKEGFNNFSDRTGANNVIGEFNGNNKKRQNEWEHLVAKEAQDAQNAEISRRRSAEQISDLNASKAAGSRSNVMGSRINNLNWKNPNGGDTTDFLGL